MAEWYCPNCNFKNRDSNKTCTSCGMVRPGTAVPKPDVNEPVWICPNCSHKNSTDHSTCFSCGKPRYGDTAQSGNS
ncbi:MAG: zinc ribbon domain-containing protein, partial [Oscillospiraceae bacterium]|nr:zinc ribbon domain-containing protein [Oscillospiraceae bacterium]